MRHAAGLQTNCKIEQQQEQRPDRELVDEAREGSSEAFGELVRRHRARVYGWAARLTRDGYLAEDIVQEALIRAFLQLDQLLDSRRFGAWLKTIVRNQAHMKLRRGGPYGKERPFSGFFAAEGEREPSGQVDELLARLSQKVDYNYGSIGLDPAEVVTRREVFETFREMLRCLTEKERGIFEAYFFRELSPDEIAVLFGTTMSSVYNHLSRARAKVRRERIRICIRGYVDRRRQEAKPAQVLLDPGKIVLKG